MSDDDLDPCPYCGRDDFGNAGARAQHVRSCKEKAEQYTDQHPNDPAQGEPVQQSTPRSESSQQQPVAVDDSQQQAQQSNELATPEQAVNMGAQLGDIVSAGVGGSPEERAEAEGSAFRLLGGALAQIGQRREQEKKAGAQRSKQASQDSLQRVEEYVTCPECDTQITNLPEPGTQFQCPGCGTYLEYQG